MSSKPMEAINRAVVMRSYGLRSSVNENGERQHDSYGSNFHYREWLLTTESPLGALWRTPLALLFCYVVPFLMTLNYGRAFFKYLKDKNVVAGSGPSPELQESGGFRQRIAAEVVGHEPRNEVAVLQIEGKKDPGYGWTSIILAETALHIVSKLNSAVNPEHPVTPPAGEYGGSTPDAIRELVEEGKYTKGDDIVFDKRGWEAWKGGFWTTVSAIVLLVCLRIYGY